ncbi:GumC family protein [Candidatus Uabimicrobium amorphum]|uniref:Uncharacterized protein n=1 Tax=Uabimicrobium amorphum TaxID=2596890 RepID=A0A5S9F5R9_UABAM|nr:hypothetical protein [Candidatus Uabimicrobium amorphum]BBM86912.1 hypothetical protein UABAM_05314 [Candidatus Uabimicrobium amorphum]
MPTEEKKPLPIHIPTTIKAFLMLWWFAVLTLVIGVFVSIITAISFGKELYRCRAIYLYSPKQIPELVTFGALSLQTHVSLIKLPANLEVMAQRLGKSSRSIAGSFNVIVGKKEGMVTFLVESSSATDAFETMKVVTDVFISSQIEKRRSHAQEYITAFNGQYQKALQNLRSAQQEMQTFIQKNKIVDISKEKQWYLEKIVSIEIELQHARIDLSATDIKLNKMQSILQDLEKKVKKERISQGQKESLTDMSLRKERLRQLISEAKNRQIFTTELRAAQENLERLQKMKNQNVASEQQISEAKARIRSIEAKLKDTKEITKWKKEIEKLDNFIVPKAEEDTPSSLILKDILLQMFNLQLQQVAAQDRVTKIENNIRENQQHLDKLAYLQEEYNGLERTIALSASVVKQYRKMIEAADLISKLKKPDFLVVSPPKLPKRHSKSNKKLIAILIFALFFMLAFAVPSIYGLISLSCRSAGEARARLGLKILGEFRSPSQKRYPGIVKRITRRILNLFRRSFTVKTHLPNYEIDGNQFYNLASKISPHIQGERGWTIALCEAHDQGSDHLRSVGYGLSYYISKMGYKTMLVDMVSHKQTDLQSMCESENISYVSIPISDKKIIREQSFADLLEKAKDQHNVIFILAPTAEHTASFRLCVRYCEGSIMLIEAGVHPFWHYFKAKNILKEEESVILGMSVSNIQRPF